MTGVRLLTVVLGQIAHNDNAFDLRVSKSSELLILEIEPSLDPEFDATNALETLSYLMTEIQKCQTEDALFKLTTEMLQFLSGYDRIMIYQFDRHYNGEVLEEVKRQGMDSFLGLRFPHWDIPSQARDIMKKIPLRFIQDVDQVPVPILSTKGMPPVDITLANLRGVSPVHMTYLQNIGIKATMTLSVVVEDQLWGIISFHHRRPKVPSTGLRNILTSFIKVFEGRLLSLRQEAALEKIRKLDSGFVGQHDLAEPIEEILPSSGPLVLDIMKAHGLSAISPEGAVTHGETPNQPVIDELARLALADRKTLVIESLKDVMPDLEPEFNGIAGAVVVGVLPDRAICIFRKEAAGDIAWAGNPQKTVEDHDGRARLAPRGSFSKFLEEAKGRSEPWKENDVFLIEHLRTLLQAAERQALLDKLNRQQAMMIGELNHRVRNILALVRSISRQARRRYGSLSTYANSIEQRIKALAAAHDVSTGRLTGPVSIQSLASVEFEPYAIDQTLRTEVTGDTVHLRPEIAPIVALVFHELTTNAAKYGALSQGSGSIKVKVDRIDDGVSFSWKESGGPSAIKPNELGFGLVMIEQAIPHELGGTAEIAFLQSGFSASFTLPLSCLWTEAVPEATKETAAPLQVDAEPPTLAPAHLSGRVLLVEDNFIIAKEMSDQLKDIGFEEVFVASTVDAALEFIEEGTPLFSVLDVNLGPSVTSEPIAQKLSDLGAEFVFVSGYGEDLEMFEAFKSVPRLTKPITDFEFYDLVSKLKIASSD